MSKSLLPFQQTLLWISHKHIYIHVRVQGQAFGYQFRPTTPSFCLSKAHFFTTLCIHLGLPHLIVAHLSWCQCGHTIDDLGIHLLWCPCGNECKAVHDIFQDIIAAIILESGTHVKREVSHLFPCYTKRQMDILITSTMMVIQKNTCSYVE